MSRRLAPARPVPHIGDMVFRAKPPSSPAALPATPAGCRVYAVGDIHGRLDLLQALSRKIAADAQARAAERKLIVFLGDYLDRGEQSRGVIDWLLDRPLEGFEHIHLKGNHEDILLRFLKDISVGPNWFAFGGLETLASYGVALPESLGSIAELEETQRALAAKLPPRHREFLRGLPLSHAEGDYLFVHAGVRPGIALERQSALDLMWIREDFLLSDEAFGKVVVHGHTIVPEPEERPNRIGIDTGAFATGRLTCLVLEGTTRRYLRT